MRLAFVLPLFALLAACAPPAPRVVTAPSMPIDLSSAARPPGRPGNLWCYEVGNAPARIAPECKPSVDECEAVLSEARRAALADGLGDPFSGCRALRGEEMTRAHLLSGNAPVYPRAAREAQAQGNVVARCTVTVEGRVESCEIILSLPLMDQAILAAVTTWRLEPIRFLGRPVRTSYTFPFKIAVE